MSMLRWRPTWDLYWVELKWIEMNWNELNTSDKSQSKESHQSSSCCSPIGAMSMPRWQPTWDLSLVFNLIHFNSIQLNTSDESQQSPDRASIVIVLQPQRGDVDASMTTNLRLVTCIYFISFQFNSIQVTSLNRVINRHHVAAPEGRCRCLGDDKLETCHLYLFHFISIQLNTSDKSQQSHQSS
jgi:hypothetical protein